MLAVLAIVAPVFGLIALGYVAGRLSLLSATAEKGVAEFAFSLAMPALLFKSVATAEFSGISIAGIWASFFGAVAVTWIAATLITWRVLKRPASDAPPIAMSSAFGNLVMLGLPLAVSTYGSQGAPVVALILSIHAPVLWLTGTLHAGLIGSEGKTLAGRAIESLVNDLSRNPIIIAILLAVLWRLTGIPLPGTALTILTLLADASVPAALIALGLSILRSRIGGQAPTLTAIVSLKMVAMPVVAYFLASQVFGLNPVTQGVITLLAAVPTGANAFIFAAKTGRAVNSASGAVAIGTIASAVTISLLLAAMRL